jgi:hypothetical protein
MSRRNNPHRPSFSELCKEATRQSLARLEERARLANHIAKATDSAAVREAAYGIKSAALSQGIQIEGFTVRSDDQCRSHIVRVEMASGHTLHMPIGGLSPAAKSMPSVEATVGLSSVRFSSSN